MKKKIFLGAYLNYTNAQNLNCLALARHLDKEKFDVHALTAYFGDNSIEDVSVKLFHCFRPFFFTKYIGFIWGILRCEILYLPKHREMPVWVLRFANLLRKKIFTTIEGNMCDTSRSNMIDSFGSINNMKSYFNLMPNIFGITSDIIASSDCGVELKHKPLFLGVEKSYFSLEKYKKRLHNIVFIGRLLKRKGVYEFLSLAKLFPDLSFHIIGDGPERKNLEKKASKNVLFYGILTHDKIADVLQNIDLHILLSRSEGFPKVILETASAGIPSIVYGDYGAEEWIVNNVNGFVLSRKEGVIEKIKELSLVSEILMSNSKGAVKLSERFSWKKLISEWEKEILNLR